MQKALGRTKFKSEKFIGPLFQVIGSVLEQKPRQNEKVYEWPCLRWGGRNGPDKELLGLVYSPSDIISSEKVEEISKCNMFPENDDMYYG